MSLRPETLRVLYEDNHLVVVYKPAGLLTQADHSGEPHLMDVVKAWIAAKYHKPGNVFLGLVHRLDRPVSGLVLFAKTSKGAARLSSQFRERRVEKVYHARLEGVIEPARGELAHFIAQREGANVVQVSREARPGAKAARLGYDTIWSGPDECVVEVRLETGRKHQIRAQFAQIGHPIIGDRLYGSRRALVDRGIALSAVRLGFEHPVTKAPIVVELPRELSAVGSMTSEVIG
jgi:23S rRNA pseudouridine1911/1915/1917 synthase